MTLHGLTSRNSVVFSLQAAWTFSQRGEVSSFIAGASVGPANLLSPFPLAALCPMARMLALSCPAPGRQFNRGSPGSSSRVITGVLEVLQTQWVKTRFKRL